MVNVLMYVHRYQRQAVDSIKLLTRLSTGATSADEEPIPPYIIYGPPGTGLLRRPIC